MTTIYTRLYAAEEQAAGAADAAKRKFGTDAVTLTAPAKSKGQYSVSVKAPWGYGNEAISLLEKFEPVGAVDDAAEEAISVSNEAAPFSAWLKWPVLQPSASAAQLSSNDAAPFSAWAKWPFVLKEFKTNVILSNDPTPFSTWAKWLPVLKASTPFSTLVPDDKSKAVLIKNPAPFSEFFNLTVLSN